MILDLGEKRGKRPHRASKSFDFAPCMDSCGVTNAGYVGSTFTRCNNSSARRRVCKILDRILINDGWMHKFQNVVVRHLARTGSDHKPLLLKCYSDQKESIRYFKFLNFWVEQLDFYDMVREV